MSRFKKEFIPKCDMCGKQYCTEHQGTKAFFEQHKSRMVEIVDIDMIVVDPANLKRARRQIDYCKWVEDSIREKGMINPLVVDTRYNLLVGHHRYNALKNLGIKKVKVILVSKDIKIDSNNMFIVFYDGEFMEAFDEFNKAIIYAKNILESIPYWEKTTIFIECVINNKI